MRREPFTTIERAFRTLLGSGALTIDGSLHPGLPHRQMPISEIVTFLRAPDSPLAACDSVWRALLDAPNREQWDLICLGLALPALRKAASRANRIWPYDPEGIQAEALNACIREIHQAKDLEEHIYSTICIHVKTACRTYARELARHAKGLVEADFESHAPAAPWAHIDLVLLRAVECEVISRSEAGLIAVFRLEGLSSGEIAKIKQCPKVEVALERKRAEHRLAEWINSKSLG